MVVTERGLLTFSNLSSKSWIVTTTTIKLPCNLLRHDRITAASFKYSQQGGCVPAVLSGHATQQRLHRLACIDNGPTLRGEACRMVASWFVDH